MKPIVHAFPECSDRLEALIRKAMVNARSAEDASEAQSLLNDLFADPDPQSLAESVRASTNAAEDAAYARAGAGLDVVVPTPTEAPKRSKK